MQSTRHPIVPAQLSWTQADTPESDQFGDVYFSKAGGLDESHYVFFEGNHLQHRWPLNPGKQFTIGEMGFGTGLNFFVAWQQWEQHKAAGIQASENDQNSDGSTEMPRLHFVSVEKHPLTREDFARVHQQWPQFKHLSDQVLAQYPYLHGGFHQLDFGDVRLTLMMGDATECWQQFSGSVDAWFLDGFAPAKNPEMWQPELFQHMARLSNSQTTLATFTAARLVRDGLKGSGFELQKRPGFGRKRDMIIGRYQSVGPQKPSNTTPWFHWQPKGKSQLPVAVIGSGLAGAATAFALAKRGVDVKVFDRHPAPAQEGSGNTQGVLYAKLSANGSYNSRFYANALGFALRQLRQALSFEVDSSDPIQAQLCGVFQSAWNPKEHKRHQTFEPDSPFPSNLQQTISRDIASQLAGIEMPTGGLWFPDCGWVNPPSLCRYWLRQSEFEGNVSVASLQRSDQGWLLNTPAGQQGPFAAVVLANAAAAKAFPETAPLPLKPIRGQVSQQGINQPCPLQTVVCAEGYTAPTLNNALNFGATFNLHDDRSEVLARDHQANVENLLSAFPALTPWLAGPYQQGDQGGRVAFRCSTPDYLPIVGPIPNWPWYEEHYQYIGRWRRNVWPSGQLVPGLYCNLGHGSRGLTSAPLTGELVAAMICGEPLPLELDLVHHLHPARFLVKQLLNYQGQRNPNGPSGKSPNGPRLK